MAVTLLEAAKLEDSIVRSSVIEEYAMANPILPYLPFESIEGPGVSYNREHTLPGVSFRGINESYTPSTGVLNPQFEALKIFGGEITVDNFILQTRGSNQREIQESMKLRALSLAWARTFIKGDSSADPREFDGLQRRLTGSQLLDAGSTSGGDVLSLAKLDELRDQVTNPTHWIVNPAIKRALSAAARNPSVGGYITYQPDAFGRQVMHYADLPILVFDKDNQDVDILPFTEENPGGGTAASTSVYCVSLMPGMVYGIQSQPGIQITELGELNSTPAQGIRLEWYSSIVVNHGRAAARLRGIKMGAVVA